MKQTSRHLFLFFILTVLTACAVGCQKKTVTCPFTTITWDNTFDDITELEGDSIDTYDSVYDGTTYTFPKEYDGLDGTIKYMFDDEEKLVCMSWMYETSNSEELADVYNKIHGEAEDMLGESGFEFHSEQFADLVSPSDVWYLESGNVILSTVDTNELKILQYTFLHPDVSEEKPQK